MIYDIYVQYDDENYKDVYLDMALEDYHGEVYRAHLVKHKDSHTFEMNSDILYSPNGAVEFQVLKSNDIPSWVRNLHRHLTPRMYDVMETGVVIRRFVEDAEAA